ncbi:MAG TPA: hypothetical protein VK013_07750 [Myxococcaceae bacterium]|nr:hypothetical protein [Myxococcaceae bacterium]
MRRWAAAGAVGLLMSGCAGSQQAKTRAEGAAAVSELAEILPLERAPLKDERLHPLDVNADGKPDVWSFSVQVTGPDGSPTERLVRKQLDLNGDGRVDVAQAFDDDGRLVREALDLDFDGRIDQVNHYDAKGQVTRKERDLNSDGRADLWHLFEQGQLVRKERDVNGDGRIDYWEYWEADAIDRIGEDLDGDGQVDRWTRSQRTLAEDVD